MKTLMTICAAAIALAIPAGALAHDGHGNNGQQANKFQHVNMGHHFGWSHNHSALAALTGTGTSFGSTTATATGTVKGADALATGTFTATVNTNWAASTTKTFDKGALSCAPATATLALTGATATDTLSSSLTGQTCAWTKTDGTIVRTFFGRGTSTGAGTLAPLTGNTGKAFLFQKADGTISGAAFAGMHDVQGLQTFGAREHIAAQKTGNCDHNK
ncbi:MAG TPA: hypothetical protein VF327_00110 [Gaiellaceae bacterium]